MHRLLDGLGLVGDDGDLLEGHRALLVAAAADAVDCWEGDGLDGGGVEVGVEGDVLGRRRGAYAGE